MKSLLHFRDLTKHSPSRWRSLRRLLFRLNPLCVQLHYFVGVSLLGLLALRVSDTRSDRKQPKVLDLFFTSVSAATVSSMSTVEMEVFSNTQLLIITLLMLVGGELFTSMLGLLSLIRNRHNHTDNPDSSEESTDQGHELVQVHNCDISKTEMGLLGDDQKPNTNIEQPSTSDIGTRTKSMKCLVYVVLSYLILVQVSGCALVYAYTSLVPSAKQVLEAKGISLLTFSAFTSVSTFTNCGFIPTNENMVVFSKNSGLLLILIPPALLGNTFYAPVLRLVIRVADKIAKRRETGELLRNGGLLGYTHLLSGPRCVHVAATNFVLLLVQLVFFSSFEWNSSAMVGLSSSQKVVGSVFQVVNSRHTGESVVDLSVVSSAVLVVFIVAMYLPSYYAPFRPAYSGESNTNKRKFGDYMKFSKLSYLVAFIVVICITERHRMKEDPLNFNVLNITLEVVSAYGNVGFSTGYSCKRRLMTDSECNEASYGFVGRWSDKGKLVLILVMLFGRLKNSIPTSSSSS